MNASLIKELRDISGAGMMDCKKALEENDNDIKKATEWLREKGIAKAAKKAGRIAAEGLSTVVVDGNKAVILEINCETDFVAKSDPFKELAHNVALQIAASNPKFVSIDEVDAASLENERKIYMAQALNEGKPEQVAAKIVEGRINKYYKEVCLLEQEYFRDTSKTIRDVVNEAILSTGEKITIRRFTRYEMGEGLEKRVDDFAAEVAKQASGA